MPSYDRAQTASIELVLSVNDLLTYPPAFKHDVEVMRASEYVSTADVTLGLLGMLGGVFLLSAFLPPIDSGLNPVRLFFFSLGSMAVVAAVDRHQVGDYPSLARAAAGLALLGPMP